MSATGKDVRECQFLVQDRRGNMMLVDGAEPNSIGCMFEVHHISPHLPNSSGCMFEVHRTPRPLTQTPELRAPHSAHTAQRALASRPRPPHGRESWLLSAASCDAPQ